MAILVRTKVSEDIYVIIGQKLKGSSEQPVLVMAQNAIDSYSKWRKIISFFSKIERRRRRAQIEAANLILLQPECLL